MAPRPRPAISTRPPGATARDAHWRNRAVWGAARIRRPHAEWTRRDLDIIEAAAEEHGQVVQIGVAEGASAAAIRSVMSMTGCLTLIDPYYTGRLGISLARVVARRTVRRAVGPEVRWLRATSVDAEQAWTGRPIDFLHLDGLHDPDGLWIDLCTWVRMVEPGGTVVMRSDVDCPPALGAGPLWSAVGSRLGLEVVQTGDSAARLRVTGSPADVTPG